MAVKKTAVGEQQPKDLWKESADSKTIKDFANETIDVEKILWYGESNSGKTRAYLDILAHLKNEENVSAEKVCMCIIFSDRATGITKLYHLIPKEYVNRVFIFPVSNYEEMVKATAESERILMKHFEKTKTHGWLILELLEEAWRFAQDYYSRQSFGETLADLMATKRQEVHNLMVAKNKEDKETAYQVLSGFRDWVTIKFFHNFNWIYKIKRMPFNVGATAEIREEVNPDSMFAKVGAKPAGEKDNMHRFDTIIYKKHLKDKFYQRCFKLTGYSRLYSDVDITDKNSYTIHKKVCEKFERSGYKTGAMEEIEKEAGIEPPKPKAKEEPKSEEKPKEEKKEEDEWEI